VEWKAADSPAIPYDDHYSVPDFSFFRFQTLDRFAEPGLEILADILDRPQFTDDEFETERQNLVSRVSKDSKTSRGRARQRLAREIGSLSSDLYGTSASLKAMDFAGAQAFSEAYFDPASMLFVIGSGWPIEKLRTLTEATLGQIETIASPIEEAESNIPSACPWSLDEAEPNEVFGDLSPLPLWIDDQGDDQSYVILAKWIEAPDEAGPSLSLMNSILSESIAFQLREREGLAYSIGSSIQSLGEGRWLWMAAAGTRPENLPRLLEGLRELPDTAFAELPTEDTLDTRRTKMKGRSLMRRVTRMNWAYHAGLALRRGQDAENLDARFDAMETLSPLDVAQAYEKYLRDAPAAVFIAK
jgi:predicted Zn-dependent peptidase